jgi:putative transposase
MDATEHLQLGGTGSTLSPSGLLQEVRDEAEALPPMKNEMVGRKHPARGVLVSRSQPTIVFLTVCTEKREPWLAQKVVQESLEEVWRSADTWLVGYYLLMPDHLHLFCAPRDVNFSFQQWLAYWKSQFKRNHRDQPWRFQRDGWDTRLRRSESYTDKWNYIRENPVRKGLIAKPDDWPFWGMLNVLPW